jgi:glutaredoxin 3
MAIFLFIFELLIIRYILLSTKLNRAYVHLKGTDKLSIDISLSTFYIYHKDIFAAVYPVPINYLTSSKLFIQKISYKLFDAINYSDYTIKKYRKERYMKNVVVFSTPSCPWCTKVKQYLQQKQISFKELDVSVNVKAAQDMIRKTGQMGVPQIWVDNQAVVGFDKSKLDRLLDIAS